MAQTYSSSNRKAVRCFEKALAQLQRSDKSLAEQSLHDALRADSAFPEAHIALADLCMGQQRYPEAIAHYQAFLRHDVGHSRWQNDARRAIDLASFRLDALSHPVPFAPANLGAAVNGPDDDYLPALTADGRSLVFTRRCPSNRATTASTPFEEDFYCSLWQSGQWSAATVMPPPLNSHDNEGAATISADGRIMIFTACGRRDGAGRCDLYRSVWHGDKWGRPRNLGEPVNTPAWESQPSLSFDGRTLFFVSNRKGGFGGMDIWYSTLVEGVWSAPVNLGPTINTEGDETSPFIHFDNNTLYFVSNGHPGLGGSDIFVARRIDDTAWSQPVNLGYPINTEADEGKLIVSPDGTLAYFTSDKLDGFGKQDIYSFELPAELRPQPVSYVDSETDTMASLPVGSSMTLDNVHFATGQHTLIETSLVQLDKVARFLLEHPSVRIRLEGHTDNVGLSSDNQLLSERRARAVYDYLVAQGVPPQALSYQGFGDTQPVADNDSPEGRALNRRTAFTILQK